MTFEAIVEVLTPSHESTLDRRFGRVNARGLGLHQIENLLDTRLSPILQKADLHFCLKIVLCVV